LPRSIPSPIFPSLIFAGRWLAGFSPGGRALPIPLLPPPTDESLTTKVDTLRRLFRKLMTYNIPPKKSPEMNSSEGGNQRERGPDDQKEPDSLI